MYGSYSMITTRLAYLSWLTSPFACLSIAYRSVPSFRSGASDAVCLGGPSGKRGAPVIHESACTRTVSWRPTSSSTEGLVTSRRTGSFTWARLWCTCQSGWMAMSAEILLTTTRCPAGDKMKPTVAAEGVCVVLALAMLALVACGSAPPQTSQPSAIPPETAAAPRATATLPQAAAVSGGIAEGCEVCGGAEPQATSASMARARTTQTPSAATVGFILSPAGQRVVVRRISADIAIQPL